jgi:guanosine-3',5'-bis(diphosphate) 3'-pyrophosphohydrolase
MTSHPKTFAELKTVLEHQYPGEDLSLVALAYEFAADAHTGQVRASGEPYIEHPLAVAAKLADMKLDLDTVIAGLLHDVPEDTAKTLEEIRTNFGDDVASLVEGITKLGQIKYRGMERYVENLRKMFVAMSRDIRVIFIKFADRIHNLQTLSALRPEKQKRIAMESLEIYAPIAGRLGMSRIKGELEDLAFPYVYPEDYQWLTSILPEQYATKERQLSKAQAEITKLLAEHNLSSETVIIHGRTKHIYSLYKKLLRPQINRDISKIYDLVALRIVAPTVADCYSVLGIIHSCYRPIPGRIKDYISQPKPNGYQSLHTTVITDDGIIEVQIRTPEMHRDAEYGVAAHWQYKEQRQTEAQKLKWIEDLVAWQQTATDNEQFMQGIKLDLFQNRIFVFTPKGDVIDLPEDATPVDFAYHVHTGLGDQCSGARVNDQLVSLDTLLKSGDVVEVLVDRQRKLPNIDWLKSVKTSMARSKIKEAHKKSKKTALERLKGMIRKS